MRRLRAILAALALCAACSHARTTDDGTRKPAEREPQAKRQDRKPAPRAPGSGTGSELHPGRPDAVPVATAPEALLEPGAGEEIRTRLIAGGYLGADDEASGPVGRQGIRRFQREHDLPATGVADHETVKALGLEPERIFRQATVKE